MQVTEHELGVSWCVDDEGMARSWHVLSLGDQGVWLIDPADAAGTAERAAELGEVRGVIQLLDRHGRANAALAERFGVPLHRLPDEIAGGPFEVIRVLDRPGWRERALWLKDTKTLIVAEVVGAGPQYRLGDGPIGVHPMLRLHPPGGLDRFADAEHVLMGHGPPHMGPNAGADMLDALKRTRRDLVRLPLALTRMPKPFRRSRL